MTRPIRHLSWLLAMPLATACWRAEQDGPGTVSSDPDRPSVVGTYQGPDSDAGFGSAVASALGCVWASAPHGESGVVYELQEGALIEVIRGGGRLGSSLAAGGGTLLAGAPLSDEVLDLDGNVVWSGASAGIALAVATSGAWQIAHRGGATGDNGTVLTTSGRPASVALLGDQAAVGTPFGDVAVRLQGGQLDRQTFDDRSGFSLASGDLDGDGDSEWVVGAPGARRVDLVAASLGTVEARVESARRSFGSAVAVGDVDGDGIDDLLVGAPTDDDSRGAALLYLEGDFDSPALVWEGEDLGDQFGFSVALLPGHVVVGAPGAPGAPGTVFVIAAP